MSCPICNSGYATTEKTINRTTVVKCATCGDFEITNTAILDNTLLIERNRWKISAWLREFKPILVKQAELEQAHHASVPSLMRRADRMLIELRNSFSPGSEFSSFNAGDSVLAAGWNRNEAEARFMIEEVLCRELGYLHHCRDFYYQISAKGLIHLDTKSSGSSKIGFCAMWFGEEVKQLWIEVIEPAIRESGYEPLRIDGKQHNGKIDDEIMASIRASRFVVSDFTGNRGGVYYEAGFAHGLGLPVVFMCREGDALHFDVRQYNTIFWKPDQLQQAKSNLKNRILATLGQGPLRVQ